MKEFSLVFEGYYITMDALPEYGGIYLVYKGSYNKETNTVSLVELVYIGEADNIKKRHTDGHEHQKDFENKVKDIPNGKVIYSVAKLENEEDRERVENALIYYTQPDINTTGKSRFKYPVTRVISNGKAKFLARDITQERVD